MQKENRLYCIQNLVTYLPAELWRWAQQLRAKHSDR